jgi:hypothetical protein
MVDPNRKINLQNTESSASEEEDLNDEHIQMVKEYEEEFRDRFTERDEEFMNFCKQKAKPPIIVFPFDNFHNNHHRGGGGGGRWNRGGNHHHYHRNRPYDRNQDRRNFHYHNNQQYRPRPPHHHNNDEKRYDAKRPRHD